MRQQCRNGHVLEQFAGHAAEKRLAQLRMVVSTRYDQVGREIGSTRQQNLRYRKVAPDCLFGFDGNPVPLQVPGNPLDGGAILLNIRLLHSNIY